MPGVARRLLTFLASPRKVSKRRRPQESLPAARVPKSSDSQPASQTNSLRSNMFAPLNPSDHHLPWQRQMRNVKSSSLVISRQCVTPFKRRGCAWCSTVTMPFVRDRKWKKKWVLFERSEFRPLPIFCPAQTGTPKGQRRRGRLSLLTFFGEAKKAVSYTHLTLPTILLV